MNNGPGNLFVVAAPSGTGKTSLVKAIVESIPGITVSISHTTRQRRPAEIHGLNYYFIDETEFRHMIAEGDFLEHAMVFDNLYGTSRKWVENTLASGLDVVLEIDWQGAQQIQHLFPECISIFILPPSLQTLADRLLNRNQDSSGVIHQRLADVRESASHIHEFNYVVMNDDFTQAKHDLITIIEAGRLLQKRQAEKYAKLLAELTHIKNLSAATNTLE
jgi:guanylate kinase